MLTSKEISNLVYEHRENTKFTDRDSITFDEAYESCRKYINNNSKKALALLEGLAAKEATEELIDQYVDKLKKEVVGYEESKSELRKALKEEIVDYKAISELMSYEGIGRKVTEIRINAHNSIIYEMGGKTYVWPKTFKNPDELEKVLNKLLGDEKRLSRATPFLNSSTAEGFRINASDRSISRNGDDYTAVIRKYSPGDEKLQIEDIIEYRTLSDNMAKFLDIVPKARFSFLTVGGTGSGKTVTNEIIIRGIRPMDRQVYIENPCELTPGVEGGLITVKNNEELLRHINRMMIDHKVLAVSPDAPPYTEERTLLSVRKNMLKIIKDEIVELYGKDSIINVTEDVGFLNDYIQMNSNSDKKDPGANDPTPNNLVENALRQTPVWIIVGESRSDEEFIVLLKAAQTGHKVITTFHAEDPPDAIRRYLMAYMAASNVPHELVLENICSSFTFIINVEKLHDGSRRVMYITEIEGSKGTEPLLNDIYKYKIDRVDSEGKIHGKHERVGKLSENAIIQMRKMGIPDIDYHIYTQPPGENEEETYNGVV